MTKLIAVEDLNIAFGDKPVVDHVSFDIRPGETMALVGESGSGKSLSALSIAGLLPDSAQISGTIMHNGTDLLTASEGHLRGLRGNEISFIFQEPMTSLNPLQTIERQVAEVIRIHGSTPKGKEQARVLELLDRVGIQDAAKRMKAYPHELSGGQRQRVMIAMAIANRPKLLIADEPTTALDVTIQAQILDLLMEMQAEFGMAMLFITHDLNIVRHIADRVCVMQDGQIVERGAVAHVFESPQHAYTKMLLSAEPSGTPEPVPADAGLVARAAHLKVWFPVKTGLMRRVTDHIKAVNDANITLRAGETLGIVGESGSGKTTLALAMMRLISSEGEIYLGEKPVHNLQARELRNLRRDVQMVFQDPYGSLSPRMNIAQIIAEGLEVHEGRGDYDARVCAIMEEVGLDPEMRNRYPHEFSGGQRQRIAIARAMILNPKLVVLDEPTSALDMTVQVQIVELLKRLQAKLGLAYIFISHDLRVVRALSHQVMVMKTGDVVEAGGAEQVFDAPQHSYTKTLMNAAFANQSP